MHNIPARILSLTCKSIDVGLEPHQILSSCEVNKRGGSSVSWKKHGVEYGWRLSMCLAGWLTSLGDNAPEQLPKRDDPGYEAAVRALISCAQFTGMNATLLSRSSAAS